MKSSVISMIRCCCCCCCCCCCWSGQVKSFPSSKTPWLCIWGDGMPSTTLARRLCKRRSLQMLPFQPFHLPSGYTSDYIPDSSKGCFGASCLPFSQDFVFLACFCTRTTFLGRPGFLLIYSGQAGFAGDQTAKISDHVGWQFLTKASPAPPSKGRNQYGRSRWNRSCRML